MSGSTFKVVLDACVLIPLSVCDTLLRAAQAGLFQLVWTEAILEEVERNLVRGLKLPEALARRRVAAMRRTFPEALVTGYERLVPAMRNDEKDRHVTAAATLAGAQLIVTANLKDFRAEDLPPGMEAKSPDDFLVDLLDLDPERMLQLLREQAAALKNPPVSLERLLDALGKSVPTFAATCRRGLLGPEEDSAAQAHQRLSAALAAMAKAPTLPNLVDALRARQALAEADPAAERETQAHIAPVRGLLVRTLLGLAHHAPDEAMRALVRSYFKALDLDVDMDVSTMTDEQLAALIERPPGVDSQ